MRDWGRILASSARRSFASAEGSQVSPPLPSYVVIKKDRFARSLAGESGSFFFHVPAIVMCRRGSGGSCHWATSNGQSRWKVHLFRGTGRFHKATNKPLLKKKNRRYNNICMGPRREESLSFPSRNHWHPSRSYTIYCCLHSWASCCPPA